jgi:16S rRNA (guanine527-N7)-methyltransferase
VLPEAGARPPEFFASEIALRAPGFGVSLSADASRRLAQYLAELDTWRRRTNLTGPFESAELVTHVLESILAERLISHGIRVIDIGSGAGFPGVALAVARPDLSISLLEPRRKRVAFLEHVIGELALSNADVLGKRAQALQADAGGFQAATIRAVGDLTGTIGEALFLEAGGLLLAWTTEPARLARDLEAFTPGSVLRVPGTERRVIATFQKRP